MGVDPSRVGDLEHHQHAMTPPGPMVVETRAPRHIYRLLPGERCAVPPKTAHYVHGEADGACKFLIVQGVDVYDFVAVGG